MTHDARRHDTPRRWHMAWLLLLALGLLVPLAATPSHAVAPRSTATVAGTVVLAHGSGAAVQVRVCVLGTSMCTISSSGGTYTLGGVAAGSRTLRFTRADLATLDVPLVLRAGQRATPRTALVTRPAAGELRIVLSWGAAPADLDAFLWVPQGGSMYRVEPWQRGSLTRFPWALLHLQATRGLGPELINVSRAQAGRSTFAVFNRSAHDSAGAPALAGSGAVVEVYDQDGFRRRFVAPASGAGTWWTVFYYIWPSRALAAVNTLGNLPLDAPPTVAVPAGNGVPAFRIGRTEVSNTQFRACVTAGVCLPPLTTCNYDNAAYANHPVVCVTRDNARRYAQWVSGTLPTAAQWLRACQGGDRRVYPWGSQPPDTTRANYYPGTGPVGRAMAVGSYPAGASPYGAHDMAGNVAEYVEQDGTGDRLVAVRGGSFLRRSRYAACAESDQSSSAGGRDVGFRVVFAGP